MEASRRRGRSVYVCMYRTYVAKRRATYGRHFLHDECSVASQYTQHRLIPSFIGSLAYAYSVTMIIDAKTIGLTLVIVTIAFYGGLKFVRAFALTIAQENHDANLAIDQAEQEQRAKREKQADAAAASAYAKVEPLLTVTKEEKQTSEETKPDEGVDTI